MYYIVLLLGLMTFLTLVAWRFPGQPQVFARQVRRSPEGRGESAGYQAMGPVSGHAAQPQPQQDVSEIVARALKSERKQDMPCLTPIDCVESDKCDGHCGNH